MYQQIIGRSSQRMGNAAKRIGSPTQSDDSSNRTQINSSLLRRQGPAWLVAGGGMGATLEGVYLMLRSFRRLRYI
ncbi:hypothetical protein BDV23DRAFT_153104 [Aspergillus alliaceus]|uniref:Uncharacterized protein n=1 Tax=Petromyces alliaceus TaxID=209559 RepID=A0A5N6FN15_PETAA|nr:uncharacterized protein BDW43DRAFT_313144 [Aspergillus alliaceus]KAB8231331.1 hypothetical protein BDW43DRAFT_313144 [Aspergillus alliaceus]KAE8391448.1 hypothetical protein BDV23DRAFT_153104 [Aspergillus alliaceus]